MGALILETLLGFLTCTASLMAFGKLQEILPTRPITYRGQNIVNLATFGLAVGIGIVLIFSPEQTWLYPIFVALSLLFGVLLIIPIGGADMPTVIALLNSYAGLSASAMGFALDNKLLIVAGALDGSSGIHSCCDHVPCHEPLFFKRVIRRLRHDPGKHNNVGRSARSFRYGGRGRGDSRCRAQRRDHSRVWHGGRASPAQTS